jgi:hypothetical protein
MLLGRTSPQLHKGVEDLRRAGEACPAGCKQLVMGDLNMNIRFPYNKHKEVIVDLLDEPNLVNTSRRFWLWTPCRTATGRNGCGAKKGDDAILLTA